MISKKNGALIFDPNFLLYKKIHKQARILLFHLPLKKGSRPIHEGGVRVSGNAVLRYFWCGFAVIFILTRGIAVSKH